MREAEERRERAFADLTEVFYFPELMEIVAEELQKRLGLLYVPEIRRMSEIGDA